MKFLTIAAICALASSVSSLKLNHRFRGEEDSSSHHGDGHHGPHGPWKNDDRRLPGHPGGPKGDGRGPKNDFDWDSFTSPCSNKDDRDCWQKWFTTQLDCKTEDKQCWGNQLLKLPCPLMAQRCWTDNISTFPCKQGDSDCWKSIIPTTYPCKQGDRQCEFNLIKDNIQKGPKKESHLFEDSESYSDSTSDDEITQGSHHYQASGFEPENGHQNQKRDPRQEDSSHFHGSRPDDQRPEVSRSDGQGLNGPRPDGQGFNGQGSNRKRFDRQGPNGQGFNEQGPNGQRPDEPNNHPSNGGFGQNKPMNQPSIRPSYNLQTSYHRRGSKHTTQKSFN